MKTSRILTFCLAALAIFAAASCQVEPTMELDGSNSFEAGASGGSQSVKVTTNFDWSANASDPWIHVSPSSGSKGTANLTITADANDTGKDRSGSVTVTCGTITKTIRVTQAANLNQKLVFKHGNSTMTVPSISGSGVKGVVQWGDGAEENYSSSLSHTYSSSGSHTVTIALAGAGSFEFASLEGVTEIDVSGFR